MTVDGMATTICFAMNIIHLNWNIVPSSGTKSLPPNWCWSWVTVSTMKTKKKHMDTQTEAGEKVSVRFTGLLAHWFENVIQDNILFGMDEITVDGFFQQYKDLLGGTISYGFPACCSIEGLRKRMEREHIRVFVIDSSLGLCGFVLAQEVELQCP